MSVLLLLAAGVAGAALARLLRLPMWPFTGAVLAVALLQQLHHVELGLPGWWSLVAQILVGTAVGGRLGREVLLEFRSVLAPGVVVVLTVIPAGVGLGILVHYWTGLPALDTVFGLVPGGVGEMVAATASLNGNSALVAGMHLARLLVVVWTAHVAVRWLRRAS
jgi:membrane AbrB-like protein